MLIHQPKQYDSIHCHSLYRCMIFHLRSQRKWSIISALSFAVFDSTGKQMTRRWIDGQNPPHVSHNLFTFKSFSRHSDSERLTRAIRVKCLAQVHISRFSTGQLLTARLPAATYVPMCLHFQFTSVRSVMAWDLVKAELILLSLSLPRVIDRALWGGYQYYWPQNRADGLQGSFRLIALSSKNVLNHC